MLLYDTNLLIEEGPEDRNRQEDIDNSLEGFDIINKRVSKSSLGIVKNGIKLFVLASTPPFTDSTLKKSFTKIIIEASM